MLRSTHRLPRDCAFSMLAIISIPRSPGGCLECRKRKVRDLYRGILQITVTYLHVTRGNYNGAIKVYGRSLKWMQDWPEVCRGIRIGQLRRDTEAVINEVKRLGIENIGEFDRSLLRAGTVDGKGVYLCDRCGSEMHERNCKVTCPNCGNRFDCSDLNIYFD